MPTLHRQPDIETASYFHRWSCFVCMVRTPHSSLAPQAVCRIFGGHCDFALFHYIVKHTCISMDSTMAPRFTVVHESVQSTIVRRLANESQTVIDTLTGIQSIFSLNMSHISTLHETFNISNVDVRHTKSEALKLLSPSALPGLLIMSSILVRLAHFVLVCLIARRLIRRRNKID